MWADVLLTLTDISEAVNIAHSTSLKAAHFPSHPCYPTVVQHRLGKASIQVSHSHTQGITWMGSSPSEFTGILHDAKTLHTQAQLVWQLCVRHICPQQVSGCKPGCSQQAIAQSGTESTGSFYRHASAVSSFFTHLIPKTQTTSESHTPHCWRKVSSSLNTGETFCI